MTPNQTSVPWDPTTAAQWLRDVEAIGWQPQLHDDGTVWYWRLEGPCPRCGHTMSAETGPGYAEGLALREARGGDAAEETVWVACNCTDPHGREAGERGCGPSGYIRGPAPRDAEAALERGS